MSHIATVETNKLLEEVLYELREIRKALEVSVEVQNKISATCSDSANIDFYEILKHKEIR
jgi:hypothetical protein